MNKNYKKTHLILAAITLIAGLLLGAGTSGNPGADSEAAGERKNRNPVRTYSRRQLPLKK